MSSNGADLTQWVLIAVTVGGLVVDHFWTRRQLGRDRDQDQFDKYIFDPSKEVIKGLDDLYVEIISSRLPEKELAIKQAVLVRNVNTFLAQCVDSSVSGGSDWYSLSTREIEQSYEFKDDGAITELCKKTQCANIERLKQEIQTSVSEKRPT